MTSNTTELHKLVTENNQVAALESNELKKEWKGMTKTAEEQ